MAKVTANRIRKELAEVKSDIARIVNDMNRHALIREEFEGPEKNIAIPSEFEERCDESVKTYNELFGQLKELLCKKAKLSEKLTLLNRYSGLDIVLSQIQDRQNELDSLARLGSHQSERSGHKTMTTRSGYGSSSQTTWTMHVVRKIVDSDAVEAMIRKSNIAMRELKLQKEQLNNKEFEVDDFDPKR